MSVHFTIPLAQGTESIPLGGGCLPSYPGTYLGMEHPRLGRVRAKRALRHSRCRPFITLVYGSARPEIETRPVVLVEDKRPLCQLYHLRPTGSRTPDSRCFVEGKRPLCQLSSKRLEDNWQSGLLSSAVLATAAALGPSVALAFVPPSTGSSIEGPHKATHGGQGEARSHIPAPPRGAATPRKGLGLGVRVNSRVNPRG